MRSPSFFLSFFALELLVNGARVFHSSTSMTSMSFLSHLQNVAPTEFPSSSSNSPSSSASSTLFSSSSSLSETSNPLPSSFSSSHATTSSSSLQSLATTVTTEQSSTTSTYAPISTPVLSTFTAAPLTTLVVTPTADTASIAGVITPTASTNASRDLSLSGFWNNKSSVAATFTVVALIVCALIGGAIFILARQRKRDKELMAAEEFFDKHNSTVVVDATREPSLAPSMTRETTYAPTNVYMNRDIHFGSHYIQPTYGLDYPQGVAYSQVDELPTHSTDGHGNSSTYLPPQPFVSVAQAPPSSYRQPRGRAPGTYQPSSVDSFYGGIAEK